MSLSLSNITLPQPATQRNFTTHLSYNSKHNAIAYPCGNSAFIRGLSGYTDKKDEKPLAIQFTGHANNNVTVVKFSPQPHSQYVVSGDVSGKVIVWSWQIEEDGSVETKIKSEFQVLASAVTDIAWDMDATRLCIVGDGRDQFGVFISWDTGNTIGELSGHSSKINACDIKRSRPMRAATVDDQGKVGFFQGPPFKFANGDHVHHGPGKFVRDVKFQPGDKCQYFVTVGSDRRIALFDAKEGEFVKYIEDANHPINGGLFAVDWLDQDKIVTVSADCFVRVWNIQESTCTNEWDLSEGNPNPRFQQVGVTSIQDGQGIATLSLSGTLTILSLDKQEIVATIKGHNKGITSLDVNPLVTGSFDGKVMDWKNESLYENHNNLIIALSNKQYPQISSLSWDDTLQINDEVKYQFPSQPQFASTNINTDDKDELYAVITNDNELVVIHSYSGEIVNKLPLKEHATCVTLSTNHIAVGYERSNDIEIFQLSNLETSHKLKTPMRSTPSYISISPSEKYIAVGDVLGKINLFDMETREVKTSRWAFHTGKINSISWKPCGENDDDKEDLVATGSLDTHIIIYSVQKPMRTIKVMNAHKDSVNNVMWDNVNTLVSTGSDAVIKTWDLQL